MAKHKPSSIVGRFIRRYVLRGGRWIALLVFASSASAQINREPQPEPDSDINLIPFSEVIRDEYPPYESAFRKIRVGPSIEPRFGGGGEADVDVGIFARPSLEGPFSRGFRPEEAELKLGPFYLDVESLSGGVLWSDNVERTEINEEEDVIGIVRLRTTALLQLSDNFRFAVTGVLVWLPFENEVGISGFGADDFFARLDYGPIGRAQISYDLKLANWEFLAYDDLSVHYIRPIEGLDFDIFDEGEEFDEVDRAGRYVYRQHGPISRDADRLRKRTRRGLDDVFLGVRNIVGGEANTLLPTVTRLTLGAFHENYWYIDRPRNASIPEERDQLYAALVSERETLRFKPYLTARTWTTDQFNGWRKEAHVGAFGPITENLFVRGDVGHFWGPRVRDSVLWLFSLRHTPHERMYHEVRYSRRVADFDDDLRETLSYRMHYRFSEDFYADLLARRTKYDDVQSPFRGTVEKRVGLRLTYDLAQRTTLRLSGIFSRYDNENPTSPDVDKWIGRAEVLYRYSASIHARLLYQHEIRDSNIPLDSYDEDLVVLTLTKYF